MLIKHKGYVLFGVLVILQILTWLSLENLEELINVSHLSRQHWVQQTLKFQTEKFLPTLLSLAINHCHVVFDKSKKTNQNITWWQTHACSYREKENIYYYGVDNCLADPCSLIHGTTQSANYCRMRILATVKSSFLHQLRLEVTYIVPRAIQDNKNCQSNRRIVKMGIQSIAYLEH